MGDVNLGVSVANGSPVQLTTTRNDPLHTSGGVLACYLRAVLQAYISKSFSRPASTPPSSPVIRDAALRAASEGVHTVRSTASLRSESPSRSPSPLTTTNASRNSKWNWLKGCRKAARLGKGLGANPETSALLLQTEHWLEATDPKHRYGSHLRPYYTYWLDLQKTTRGDHGDFFYWLDEGDGRLLDLETEGFPREQLESERVRYLTYEEREKCEVEVDEHGLLRYKGSGQLVHTMSHDRELGNSEGGTHPEHRDRPQQVPLRRRSVSQHKDKPDDEEEEAAGDLPAGSEPPKTVPELKPPTPDQKSLGTWRSASAPGDEVVNYCVDVASSSAAADHTHPPHDGPVTLDGVEVVGPVLVGRLRRASISDSAINQTHAVTDDDEEECLEVGTALGGVVQEEVSRPVPDPAVSGCAVVVVGGAPGTQEAGSSGGSTAGQCSRVRIAGEGCVEGERSAAQAGGSQCTLPTWQPPAARSPFADAGGDSSELKQEKKQKKEKCGWIYVMDTSNRLYVHRKVRGGFHHSSFLSGAAVLAAGGLEVVNGRVVKLSAHSGHYRPDEATFLAFVEYLRNQGVDLQGTKILSVSHKGKEEQVASGNGGALLLRRHTI